jgi:tetratricopeptide (TPR) repeat protein
MNDNVRLDGFITPDGEKVSLKDTERLSAIFLKTTQLHRAVECLWNLVTQCMDAGYFGAAFKYIEKIVPLVDSPDHKAKCFLKMGQAMEHLEDYASALEAYARAFDLPRQRDTTWYFLNNNRAYCLNQLGCHEAADKFCRAAIAIEPRRHNAHKNLGIALSHLGRYADAAKCFVRATKLCPTDVRALAHLDELFAHHKEILGQIRNFPEQFIKCHELVRHAKGRATLQ